MKLNVGSLLVAGTLVLSQSSIVQAEPETATVRLSHSILSYYTKTEEDKPEGLATTKKETQGIDTFADSIEIAAWVKGYAFYAYPLERGVASFWVGKVLSPSLEVGPTLMFNSSKVKDGEESENNKIGAYVWYSAAVSPSVNFELNVNPTIIMGSKKTTDPTAGETKDTTSGFGLYFDAFGIVPLAKNFEYGFGLTYDMASKSTDSKTAAGKTKLKENDTTIGLVLARFRYSI